MHVNAVQNTLEWRRHAFLSWRIALAFYRCICENSGPQRRASVMHSQLRCFAGAVVCGGVDCRPLRESGKDRPTFALGKTEPQFSVGPGSPSDHFIAQEYRLHFQAAPRTEPSCCQTSTSVLQRMRGGPRAPIASCMTASYMRAFGIGPLRSPQIKLQPLHRPIVLIS